MLLTDYLEDLHADSRRMLPAERQAVYFGEVNRDR